MENRRVFEKLNFWLGAWVVVSPWVLTDVSALSNWIMVILGIDIMILAIWAFSAPEILAPKVWTIVLALLLAISPWACRFDMAEPLIVNNLRVGLVIAALTLASIPAAILRHGLRAAMRWTAAKPPQPLPEP